MITYREIIEDDIVDVYYLYEYYRSWQSSNSNHTNRHLDDNELVDLWKGKRIYSSDISNVSLCNHPSANKVGYGAFSGSNMTSYFQWDIKDDLAICELILYDFGNSSGISEAHSLLEYSFSTLKYNEEVDRIQGYLSYNMLETYEFHWLYNYANASSSVVNNEIYYGQNLSNDLINLI